MAQKKPAPARVSPGIYQRANGQTFQSQGGRSPAVNQGLRQANQALQGPIQKQGGGGGIGQQAGKIAQQATGQRPMPQIPQGPGQAGVQAAQGAMGQIGAQMQPAQQQAMQDPRQNMGGWLAQGAPGAQQENWGQMIPPQMQRPQNIDPGFTMSPQQSAQAQAQFGGIVAGNMGDPGQQNWAQMAQNDMRNPNQYGSPTGINGVQQADPQRMQQMQQAMQYYQQNPQAMQQTQQGMQTLMPPQFPELYPGQRASQAQASMTGGKNIFRTQPEMQGMQQAYQSGGMGLMSAPPGVK